MAEMLHRYYTDHKLAVLCQDCARKRRQASERCEWAETPVDWEQAGLSREDCGATLENGDEELPQPEPPDLDTLMRRMHDDGGCEAACPHAFVYSEGGPVTTDPTVSLCRRPFTETCRATLYNGR